MNKIRVDQIVLCVLLLVGWGLVGASRAADRPNIVFFLTDDQGYGDLGCYGSKDIATPNIDKLCAEGMKFNSFYVHNRCSPTRAALMTGCHAQRVGVNAVIYRRNRSGLHSDEITVAELLRTAGYATGIVGKWHLGEWDDFNPVNHGFDSFFGFMDCDDKKTTAIYRNREIVEKVKHKTDGIHSPKLLAAGIEFIKHHKEQPFFLYYASALPHVTWLPHPRFQGTSRQGTYGDVVQEIDWQVGELMKALDELDLAENTLVVESAFITPTARWFDWKATMDQLLEASSSARKASWRSTEDASPATRRHCLHPSKAKSPKITLATGWIALKPATNPTLRWKSDI